MNNLEIVEQRNVLEKDFKVYGSKEEPLFLAKDVADWIEHSNSTEMLRTIDDSDKLNSTILSAGQRRAVTLLTEYGLYEVLMQSRKPIAKTFKEEVKRILKELRVKGKYEVTDDPFQAMKLSMEVMENHDERIGDVEDKVIYLENEVRLDNSKYNYLSKLVSRVVRETIDVFAYASSNEIQGALRKDINGGINQLAGTRTRSQLKEKDFEKVVDFIQSWVPSTATRMEVQQLTLDLENDTER